LDDPSYFFNCTILNLTNLGASVQLASLAGIPDVFAVRQVTDSHHDQSGPTQPRALSERRLSARARLRSLPGNGRSP
jgi:hypothetical protein